MANNLVFEMLKYFRTVLFYEQNFVIILQMKQFGINLLTIVTLINPSFSIYQNLLLAISICIMLFNQYLRYHQYFNIKKLAHVMIYLKWITMYAQLSQSCTQQQICAQLILLTELDLFVKTIIGIGSSINSILQPNIYGFYITIPYMIVILSVIFYDYWKHLQKNENSSTQQQKAKFINSKQLSNQFDQQSSKVQIQGNCLKSPGLEGPDQQNSPMILDMQCNEEEDVLAHMAWIHNQSILVYNQNFEITYQNFYLGKLTNPQCSGVNQNYDYEQIFLECVIEIGSREVNELFGNSEVDLDQEDSLVLDSTVHSRYKIKGGLQKIRQMVSALFNNYQKWKFFTFTLFKIKSNELDFKNIGIKVLVTEVKSKLYTLFMFETVQKENSKGVLDEPVQFLNVFQTFLSESNNYINAIHLLLLLCSHDHEKNSGKISKEYLKQMRMSTQKLMIFLGTMKDLSLQLTNQLTFRNSTFKLTDLLDELQLIYEDCLKIKEISIIQIIENDMIVFNDQDRTKQILKCLFEIAIKFTVASKIRIDIHQVSPNNYQFQIKDIPFREESLKSQYQTVLKNTAQLMKTNCKDFDMSNLLELQAAAILAFSLSGSLRKPLEISFDNQLQGTFTFTVESLPINGKHGNHNQQIKPKRAFETSLSMLLAQAQDSSHYKYEESKYMSFTQISKQYSLKPDVPFDLQSAHFSQISKIKQESPQIKPLGSQAQINSGGTNKVQDSLFPKSLNNQNPSKAIKSDSAINESSKPMTSALDFGESTNPNIDLQELSPKFLHSVIKFKLTNQCCSKVIIADNDYLNVQVLQILLNKYEVKSDKAFTQQQTLQLIRSKSLNPCRCKNGAYLIYFIGCLLAAISSGFDQRNQITFQIFVSRQGLHHCHGQLQRYGFEIELFQLWNRLFHYKTF
ncbi:unnamed protein product (macronuclear) [Paramecium tetraurelia]|uniref:Transmembrane protein n=1 Tax=Paramecium tetraurelia TaxID=5888 RepID=A0DWP9_PARTE|nr:uncharacterized protein GSPATT00021109001 [Paramecium tetraurelia]CAK87466.1 unnamed protein product [Paramecium tetraurelia]|eukprot:XP_001454863.1 hypothetical protein (macronuclear) [Paramecium tetraurelia strain d4-2]